MTDIEAPCILLSADSASGRLTVRTGGPGDLHPAELRTTKGLTTELMLLTARYLDMSTAAGHAVAMLFHVV